MQMNAPSDWWRSFFTGLAVDFWLQATPEELTRNEADFVQKMLAVPAPGKLLDVPCGGGRHSRALASRGYAMTGVDFSSTLLEEARARATEQRLAVRWEEREMRELPWEREFDGAFSLGNSFGYLTDDGNAAFLNAVARTLKSGARFLLDTSYLVEGLLPSLEPRAWYQFGDFYSLASRSYDPATGRLEVEYTFLRNGQVEKKATSMRLYTYREVRSLLETAGFTDLQAYASLNQEPFQFGSKRLLMVAEKM
jgi:SAM-dependent methyltransferase